MNNLLIALTACLLPLATAQAGDSDASSTSAVTDAAEAAEAAIAAAAKANEAAEAAVAAAKAANAALGIDGSDSEEITFKAYWKNGLRFDSSDDATKIQFGGRIINDWAWFSPDDALDADVGPHVDQTEFRAARLYIKGTIDERYFFKANYDFAQTRALDGGSGFKDVYVGLKGLPVVQDVQIGHFKEPLGLEIMTSGKYITFMERSLTSGADPARNTGLMVSGKNGRKSMTYAGGIFRDTDKFGSGGGNGHYAFTGRVTGLPMTNKDHTQMIHVGAAASYRAMDGGSVRFRPRPESHLSPRYLDTGAIAADSEVLFGLEWASVHGPFSTQVEYVNLDVNGTGAGPSPTFSTYYGQVSWFATGESRAYNAKKGAFGRVKPNSPWGKGGKGAWEFALRYSHIDLDDDGVAGGELSNVTGGVNWYLSSYARIMANYVMADKDGVGDSNIFMLRFQIDF